MKLFLHLALAFVLPPVAVFVQQKQRLSTPVLLNLGLSLLFYLPGQLHALYLILQPPAEAPGPAKAPDPAEAPGPDPHP